MLSNHQALILFLICMQDGLQAHWTDRANHQGYWFFQQSLLDDIHQANQRNCRGLGYWFRTNVAM